MKTKQPDYTLLFYTCLVFGSVPALLLILVAPLLNN